MNRFAIFTACIGGYDDILQPKVVDDRFDFFLFTNEVREERIGVWHVRKVDYSNPDMTRIARYVKTHPEELLPEYEASLWLDANIQITSPFIYERFIELYERGFEVSSIQHPERDCIYDEAFEVVRLGWEFDKLAYNWCRKICKEHYPRHNGLIETGILFRKKSITIEKADELWWKCINSFSKRDQLSFNYVLWKYTIQCNYFLPNKEYARKSTHVKYIYHSKNASRKLLKLKKSEQVRYRYRINNEEKAKKQWHFCVQQNIPTSIYLIITTLIGGFYIVKRKISKLYNYIDIEKQ